MSEILKKYEIYRVADSVTIMGNTPNELNISQHVWHGRIASIYSGTVTFVTELSVVSPQLLEQDMRILLESGGLDTIGYMPSFRGVQILYGKTAQSHLEKISAYNDSNTETEKDLSQPQPERAKSRTVIILSYISALEPINDEDRVLRITELRGLRHVD